MQKNTQDNTKYTPIGWSVINPDHEHGSTALIIYDRKLIQWFADKGCKIQALYTKPDTSGLEAQNKALQDLLDAEKTNHEKALENAAKVYKENLELKDDRIYELEEIEEAHELLQAEYEALVSDYNDLDKQFDNSGKMLTEQQAEIARQVKELSSVNSDLDQAVADLEEAREELEYQCAKYDALVSAYNDLDLDNKVRIMKDQQEEIAEVREYAKGLEAELRIFKSAATVDYNATKPPGIFAGIGKGEAQQMTGTTVYVTKEQAQAMIDQAARQWASQFDDILQDAKAYREQRSSMKISKKEKKLLTERSAFLEENHKKCTDESTWVKDAKARSHDLKEKWGCMGDPDGQSEYVSPGTVGLGHFVGGDRNAD